MLRCDFTLYETGIYFHFPPISVKDGKCCFTEKFHLKHSTGAVDGNIIFTNECGELRYGTLSFTWVSSPGEG